MLGKKIIGITYNIISLIVLRVVPVGTMTTRKEDKRGRQGRLVYKVQKRGDHVIGGGVTEFLLSGTSSSAVSIGSIVFCETWKGKGSETTKWRA